NGNELLPFVDGRSIWARTMRDTMEAVLNHCGGPDYASELKRLQARRIAVLEVELIHIEGRIAKATAAGEDVNPADLDLYSRVANGQRRHCEALGWERVARDVTPSLQTIIDQHAKPEVSDAD